MMKRRTTVELDDALLARAKRALGVSTTRAAVEEAPRRAVADAEGERADRAGGNCSQAASTHPPSPISSTVGQRTPTPTSGLTGQPDAAKR